MRGWLRSVLTLLLTVLAGAAVAGTSPLAIETAGGARHDFAVELALTPQEQARGLMFRESMPADRGMLFVWPQPRVLTMWMQNTLIPLDMLFIGADGRIVRIAERTVPMSQATISSEKPAVAVLELNGGTAARLGIKPGDRVLSEALKGK
ncbi:MAG TPA: DUF192 domain-containing protein [Alphaproteobacteria bacterium]|nr:DUF192 domain-containing protein [Alphaproteobacteria bacterium]